MNIFFRTCACAFTPSIEMKSSIKFMSNFMIMISTNRFPISTPLARACSLCPIHNSQFSPRPTRPICPTRPTRPTCPTIQNSKFKIQNSKFIIPFSAAAKIIIFFVFLKKIETTFIIYFK